MNRKEDIDAKNVCAVIVTYRYAHDKLHQLVSSISGGVKHVCLIDNNDLKVASNRLLKLRDENCTVVHNGTNLGLAKAINQGIRFASENHYRYVLLLDQDSRPAPGMIEKLISAINDPSLQSEKVAAIGPVVIDRHQKGPLPFLQFKKTHIRKVLPSLYNKTFIPVDFLISSGSLLNVEILMKEGMMDESLFIDNIDLEWCFRLKNAGYQLYGIQNAFLYHRLGDNVLKIPFIDRFVLLHNPKRQYFIMRNRIFLYRQYYIPFYWKFQDFLRLLFKLFFFSIAVSPRCRNIRMMIRGIMDGVCNKR